MKKEDLVGRLEAYADDFKEKLNIPEQYLQLLNSALNVFDYVMFAHEATASEFEEVVGDLSKLLLFVVKPTGPTTTGAL